MVDHVSIILPLIVVDPQASAEREVFEHKYSVCVFRTQSWRKKSRARWHQFQWLWCLIWYLTSHMEASCRVNPASLAARDKRVRGLLGVAGNNGSPDLEMYCIEAMSVIIPCSWHAPLRGNIRTRTLRCAAIWYSLEVSLCDSSRHFQRNVDMIVCISVWRRVTLEALSNFIELRQSDCTL